MLAQLHQVPLEYVPAQGVVDVVDRPLILGHELHDGVAPLLRRGDGGVPLDHDGGLLPDDLLQQGGQVFKMVIKRVAIYAAVLYNILNGDLIEGPLAEELEEGRLDGVPGKVRHSHPPFGWLKSCVHRRGCGLGEGFCRPAGQKIPGKLGVLQDFLTRQGGKGPARTVCSACEYSF